MKKKRRKQLAQVVPSVLEAVDRMQLGLTTVLVDATKRTKECEAHMKGLHDLMSRSVKAVNEELKSMHKRLDHLTTRSDSLCSDVAAIHAENVSASDRVQDAANQVRLSYEAANACIAGLKSLTERFDRSCSVITKWADEGLDEKVRELSAGFQATDRLAKAVDALQAESMDRLGILNATRRHLEAIVRSIGHLVGRVEALESERKKPKKGGSRAKIANPAKSDSGRVSRRSTGR